MPGVLQKAIGSKRKIYTGVDLVNADENKWGDPDWRGRLTFPLPTASDSAAPATGHSGGASQSQTRDGQGVVSEQFKYKLDQQVAKPTVAVRKREWLMGRVVANWVNGKDKSRTLVYVDELQAPEAITGNEP